MDERRPGRGIPNRGSLGRLKQRHGDAESSTSGGRTMKKADPDIFKDLFGVNFDPDRLHENLQSFSDILGEIKKLRELDLTDVHPVVVFDPTYGYPEEVKNDH
jgi:hypothetical protein